MSTLPYKYRRIEVKAVNAANAVYKLHIDP